VTRYYPILPYEQARPIIRDYDVILFSGTSLVSQLIRFGTGSTFSHVGGAKWLENVLCLAESTPRDGLLDVFKGKKEGDGVRVVSLSDRVKRYKGRVYWWSINGPRTTEMAIQWDLVRRELSEVRYESDWIQFVGASWNFLRNREDREGEFCSEAWGYWLRRLGMIRTTGPSNTITPEDLSPEADDPIPWMPGYHPRAFYQIV
jgi:hypothetical protein